MPRPVIALLTDFGNRDHYAGTMKGVVLGICPEATLVDISHEVAAGDVLAAALELAAAYRYFPAGSIFLVVVDPGVGSSRRGLAAEAGDYRFVAPDNGVLSIVFDENEAKRAVELSEARYARATVSRTFEGRDRFAPAAAWLANGIDLTALGRPAGAVHRLEVPRPRDTAQGVEGEVVRVDRFGNLITNIDRPRVERLASRHPLVIRVGSLQISKVVSTYADSPPGELCALFGSTDHLEISANGASAAAEIGAGRGTTVRVTGRVPPASAA
jgi:S-adenosylmethionine hydrolase